MRRPRISLPSITAAVLGLLFAAAAQAQFPGDVGNTFRINAGGQYAWFNTNLTFEQNGGAGAAVNLEDVFNLPSRIGFYGRASFNLGFLSFDAAYVGFSRDRTATITQDIQFGDTTFTAGASVEAKQTSQLPYGDIRFNFFHNPSFQFGLTAGVAYPILKSDLTASAGVIGPNGPVNGSTVTKEAKIATPVPMLGVVLDAAFTNRLSGGIIFNGIFAPVHPYTGSIFSADAHVDYYFSPNFGVGGGFNYTRFRLKKDDLPNVLIDFRHEFYGPRAYLTATF
ncbi:MAG TPA: hypothetical protein VGH97_16295 [Thermoanaerobaculia bacterium]|jgi:hypothetical protein